jgi:hypothetical protein
VRCIDDLRIPIPAVVDEIDDRVNKAYAAHPDRLYLIGRDGRTAYAGERGPRGFDPDSWESAIKEELAGPPQRPAGGPSKLDQ